jgi:hypothetical protein
MKTNQSFIQFLPLSILSMSAYISSGFSNQVVASNHTGMDESEQCSNSSGSTCSHGTGLITRRKVFTRNRVNCSLESIYIRVCRCLSLNPNPNPLPCKMVLKKTDAAVHMAPSNLGSIPVQNET